MKFSKHSILSIIALLFIFSCSEEEDSTDTTSNNNTETQGDYFPSAVGNNWKYDVTNTNNTTSDSFVNQDDLYVVTETATTLTLDVNDGLPANGPIIGLLSSGTLTKTPTTLSVNGTLDLPAQIADLIDIEITLSNFVLFNSDANNNAQLASNTNTIVQDFNGYPLTITYQLISTALAFDENLSLNGTTYAKVLSSKMVLNLSLSTTVTVAGIPLPLVILEPQDVLVSTNYYADGIGLVQANSNNDYQISATTIAALEGLGVTLPIPASASNTVLQQLIAYNLE
jgi:hypothetical protein